MGSQHRDYVSNPSYYNIVEGKPLVSEPELAYATLVALLIIKSERILLERIYIGIRSITK